MKIFVITPHSIDSSFDEKIKIINDVFTKKDYEILTGVKDHTGEFYFDKTILLYNQAVNFIADLSFERPSCYFEVGFVQALGKPVTLIASSKTIIHQVKNKESIIFYDDLSDYKRIMYEISDNITGTSTKT